MIEMYGVLATGPNYVSSRNQTKASVFNIHSSKIVLCRNDSAILPTVYSEPNDIKRI